MKMHAQLALQGQTLEKSIHQIRFAATHPAPEIEAGFRRIGAAEASGEAFGEAALSFVTGDLALEEILKSAHGRFLGRIVSKSLPLQIVLIALPR
jgi:hypothetical protein